MQLKLSLRIASAVMLWHSIGHTIGALGQDRAPNPKIAAVISGMHTEHFEFMGRSVTLGMFFNGYGFTMIFVLLLITTQLWFQSTRPSKQILITLAIYLLIQAGIEYVYFFPLAALTSLVAGLLTLLGLRGLTRMKADS
jgi:hypothetical protein